MKGANEAQSHLRHLLPTLKLKAAEAADAMGNDPETQLIDMPGSVLADVARLGRDPRDFLRLKRHPLVPVPRGCRDLILANIKRATLHLDCDDPDDIYQPQASLLNRACRQAPPGLMLTLRLRPKGEDSTVLTQLLKPGLQDGGYPSVHALSVSTGYSDGLHMLGLAFPAMRSLSLGVSLHAPQCTLAGDGAVFSGVQGCQHLRSLHLFACGVNNEALGTSAAALARLPSLREVSLEGGTPLGLAAQLTGLTGLTLYGSYCRSDEWVTVAARNPQLQSFSMTDRAGWQAGWLLNAGEQAGWLLNAGEQARWLLFERPNHDLPASALEQLFRACPSITHFSSQHGSIDQAGLDVLLAHGTNITSLVVRQIDAQVNRSDAQCRWSRLFLGNYPTLLAIANLPLRTVQQLQLRSGILTMQLGLKLQLPVGTIPMSQLSALLRQAASNLASCPAWQQPPSQQDNMQQRQFSPLGLFADGDPAAPSFSGAQRIQLLNALAPLRGPRVTCVALALHASDAAFGQTEVMALQSSLGSGLTSLYLRSCTLDSSFWSALSQALPQLHELWLGPGVECETWPLDLAPQVLNYCSRRRPVSKPFTLHLHAGLYEECDGADVQANLNNQGLSHVSVVGDQPAHRPQWHISRWSQHVFGQPLGQAMPAAAPNS